MASQTSICNLALGRLGQPPILSIDEETAAARRLRSIWDDIRDMVLAEHPWNFAIRRASLAVLAEAPAWGWDYAYQLPADCLRVLQMGELDDEFEWEIEDGKLLTDELTVEIKYLARITVTGRFSSGFISALAYRLAAEISYDLTGNPGLTKQMLELWPMELSKAKTQDAQEHGPYELANDDWVNSRL